MRVIEPVIALKIVPVIALEIELVATCQEQAAWETHAPILVLDETYQERVVEQAEMPMALEVAMLLVNETCQTPHEATPIRLGEHRV